MEVYEPWVTRNTQNNNVNNNFGEFPWIPSQNGEAHLVVYGLVSCISSLTDIYPLVCYFSFNSIICLLM